MSSLDTKFPFWHKMSLLVSDLYLKPGTSSSPDRGSQSQSIIECTLQTSGMSIVVQVVIIDRFISRRTCGWWIKCPTNDIKGNIKGRHKFIMYFPMILFTRNNIKIKNPLQELRNKIWYPKTCSSRPFDTPQLHSASAFLWCAEDSIWSGISMFSPLAVFFSL